MSTSSIHQIPPLPEHLDRALQHRAALEGKPLETVIVEALERGLKENGVQHTDLDFLIGTWEEDGDFDEAVATFESVDEDMWR